MKKKVFFVLFLLCCTTLHSFPAFSETEISLQQKEQNEQKEQKTVTAKKITLSPKEFDSVDKIQILWARGTVTVNKSPDEKVYITQKSYIRPKETEVLGISIKNGTLFIEDYNSMSSPSIEDSINTTEFQSLLQQYHNTEYDLDIALPEKQYKEFYFKTVNADCNFKQNCFDTVITETVNGAVYFNDITSKSITANTINGEIILADTLAEQYHFSSINGNIDAHFEQFPAALSVSNTHGNITLTLPENDGFTIDKSKLKTTKNLSSSFHLKEKNNKKIYKNGTVLLDIACVSGSLTLKKL